MTREQCKKELERLADQIDTAIALREMSAGRPTSPTWRKREARAWITAIATGALSDEELLLSDLSATEVVR